MNDSRTYRRTRGFTLIEVVLSIGLGGMLLIAAASFLFGIFRLKVNLEERPAFEEHIEGVERFLDFAFANAIADEDEEDAQPVAFAEIPGVTLGQDEVLSFRLSGELPLFVEPETYLPEVDCYLVFNRQDGLYLLWQSDEMAAEDSDDLRRTPLSPYVTSLLYAYYDAEDDEWEVSEEPEDADQGGLKMPDMIKVIFTHPADEHEQIIEILLPTYDADVPLV